MEDSADGRDYQGEDKHPYYMDSKPAVFFDVDDTLVMWTLSQDNEIPTIEIKHEGFVEEAIPNIHNIAHLKKMKRRGHNVVVWSAGGASWARAVVESLELQKYVDAVLSKPDYYVDDIEDPREWMGKYGYYTIGGKSIRKSFNKLLNLKTNVGEDEDA